MSARSDWPRHPGRWAVAITLAAMGLGVVCTLLATRWGSGMAGDGHAYVASARNVIGGHWVTFADYTLGADPKPLQQFPPGYPLMLAAGHLVGLDPIPFSRVLNVGCLLLTLGLSAWLLWSHARSLWVLGVGLLVFAASPTTLFAHSNLLSEAVYVACCAVLLSALVGCYRNLDRRAWRTALLCVAAGAAGWSCTIRYAGIFLIFVGVASVLLWPTPAAEGRARLTWPRRLLGAGLFALVAAIPPAAVATFNLWVIGKPTSRPLAFHPPTWDKFAQLFETVGYWLEPAYNDPRLVVWRQAIGATALALLIALPLLWLAWSWRRRGRQSAWATTMFLFAGGYTPFIVTAFTFQDAGIPFNKRIFMPLWFAGWFFAAGVVGRAVATKRWNLPICVVVGVLAAAVVCANLAAQYVAVRARHNIGWGVEGPRWRDNKILQTLSLRHGSVDGHPIVSNVGDVIGLVTPYRSAHVPKWFSRPRRKAYSKMPDRLRQFGRYCLANDARIVYLDARDNGDFLVTEAMLQEVLHLRVLVVKRDGTIYEVTAVRGFEGEDYDGDGEPDATNLDPADERAVRDRLAGRKGASPPPEDGEAEPLGTDEP